MMKTTQYINAEGKIIKRHNGEPRSIDSFLKNSKEAVRIDITEYIGQGFFERHFFKVNDKWIGEIFKGSKGWMRSALVAKKSLIHRIVESISDEEAESLVNEEAVRVLPDAREAIRWCNPDDQNDKDGRYWISAYSGAGVYRLIVQDGNIVGTIYGGLHDSRRVICSIESWIRALHAAIEERVKGEYQLLKADGSGTCFYLREADDEKYIYVESYLVPGIDGNSHLNMEIKA